MARESAKARRERAREIAARLAATYPGSARELCALKHDDAFQLLVATILSAQCTDERVNMVTPALFARYPDAASLSVANPADVEEMVRSTGFFRAKTQHLLGMARAVEERFGGQLPLGMDELVSLPGVGRKTANVVRSVAGDLPGLPVDTHVARLSRRLRLASSTDPVKIEAELDRLLPETEWGAFSLRLILHGRAVCVARKPRCGECVLSDVCPSAGIGDLPAPRRRSAAGAAGGKQVKTPVAPVDDARKWAAARGSARVATGKGTR
jgi:endonuclease-3